MATYSVNNIKIDNGLFFTPGPTAGNVLSINGDGSTTWISAQSGTSGSSGTSGINGQNGISAGRLFYFNQSETSDVSGYKILATNPSSTTQQTVSKTLTNNQQNVLVQQFITDELGFTVIPAGIQRFKLYYTLPAANAEINAYITLELADASGTGYGQIATASAVPIDYNGGLPSETDIDIVFPSTVINSDDRMIVKLYLNNLDSTSRTVVFSTENGYYSYVITSVGVVAGTSGTSGTSGVNGTSGSNGTDGTSGSNGTNGTSGSNGTNGSSGTSGSNGTNGTSGSNGTNGSSGTSGTGGAGGGGIIQITGVTLASGSWSLSSSLYIYDYSNSGITSSSFVTVIPSNASINTVTAAQILPSTDSVSGSVRLFASYQPSGNIGATINIQQIS